MGVVFHFDESFGAEDFFETAAAEIGDGEDFLLFETDAGEHFFDVSRVVVVEAGFADFLVVGGLLAPWVDFGPTGDEAGHFGESALVGDFDNGDATGL